MEIGLVHSVDINRQMQQAYLDYAMSVIVARALPDARDGLKPVHRRILYGMYDMGLRPDSAFKKSARIVGEVMGKYHPHGDMPVYESMARMAQDFSMRYLLVEGQGNFGSVDGDPPAAMRYTEARLAAPAIHMLTDIGKHTVDFSDNFDGSLQEPDVLPAALPNLLVNGATGIAVGMSTSIPPHNLGEVIDALQAMLTQWEKLDDISVEDLMKYIQGPDFPTGGVLIPGRGEDDLKSAYGSGRGRVTLQARLHVEEMERGRSRLIVTELPYMVNKAALIERIAELSREEKLTGLSDLRDESDRHGMRVVIELSKTADPQAVIKDLYKSTPLRTTFGIILLALVDGEPRLLSLKQALKVYLEHRLTVIRRRSEYDLEKARQRAHILEGYLIALKNLDEIIALIRRSPDADTARTRLMKQYKLTEIQAQAILELQLRRLAALERKKIEEEYKEVQAQIKALEGLLKSPKKMRELCSQELEAVKEAYGDRRRTFIAEAGAAGGEGAAPAAVLAPEHLVWVTATSEGLVARSLDEKPPRLSGTGAPRFLLQANTRQVLYLAAENGEAAALPIHTLPECESPAEGSPLWKVSPLPEGARLAALFTLPPKTERPAGWHVLTCTRQGLVKRSDTAELPGPSARPFTLVKVNPDDALGWARLIEPVEGQPGEATRPESADILLATADGMAIRFASGEVRPMGLVAAGVGGIKLGGRDEVIGMELLGEKDEVLLVTSDGKAKRCAAAQFPRQGRYGQGVLAWKLPRSATLAGMAVGQPSTQVTLHLTKLAPKAMRLDEAPLQTRAAAGKDILEVKAGVQVTGLTVSWQAPGLRAAGDLKTETPKKGRAAARPPTPVLDPQAPSSSLKPTETTAQLALELTPGGAERPAGTEHPVAAEQARPRKAVRKPAASKTPAGQEHPAGTDTSSGKKKTAAQKPSSTAKSSTAKPPAGKQPAPARQPGAEKPAPRPAKPKQSPAD